MEQKVISEIQIVPIKPKEGLVGFCSFILYESLYIGSVGILTKLDGGYRLVYATKKVGNSNLNICYPIKRQLGKLIEEAVVNKFKEVMNSNDRYSCNQSKHG